MSVMKSPMKSPMKSAMRPRTQYRNGTPQRHGGRTGVRPTPALLPGIDAFPVTKGERADPSSVRNDVVMWQQEKDVAARDRALASCQAIVTAIARKYKSDNIGFEDLVQSLWVEVIQCVNKFNSAGSANFNTYVYTALRWEVYKITRSNGMIRIPAQKQHEDLLRIRTALRCGIDLDLPAYPVAFLGFAEPSSLLQESPRGSTDNFNVRDWNTLKAEDFAPMLIDEIRVKGAIDRWSEFLIPREQIILDRKSRGFTHAEIASELGIGANYLSILWRATAKKIVQNEALRQRRIHARRVDLAKRES